MKKVTNKWQCFLCHWYYFLGDMVSLPMCRWDWPLYDLYRYLMIRSSDIDEKYGQCWIWGDVEEDPNYDGLVRVENENDTSN